MYIYYTGKFLRKILLSPMVSLEVHAPYVKNSAIPTFPLFGIAPYMQVKTIFFCSLFSNHAHPSIFRSKCSFFFPEF